MAKLGKPVAGPWDRDWQERINEARALTGAQAGVYDARARQADEMVQVAEEQALDALQAVANALPEGRLQGYLLQFPVADGYARYVVQKIRPLTLGHVGYGDGYAISPIMLRGLRTADVAEMQRAERAWASIFGAPHHNPALK